MTSHQKHSVISLLTPINSSRDSGAEVSEDEIDEMGECEGNKLVSMIMTTMRKTCSLLLLSPNTDVKHGI